MRGSAWPASVLHVFERYALFEQIRDDGNAERVRRKARGQGGVREAALHHPADVVHAVADWDFAGLAAFLREAEHPLVAYVVEIAAAELRGGARA